MDIPQTLITLGSLAAAILAWIAKLRWSREFEKAKNETIKVKDARIAALEREVKSLQDMTPMKLREYFHSVKEQLEEYNEDLKKQLEQAKEENSKLQDQFHNKIDAANLGLSEEVKNKIIAVEMEGSGIEKAKKSVETINNAIKLIVKVSNMLA
jgi:hypothetical protein